MITELHAHTAELHLRVNTHVGAGAGQQCARGMPANPYQPTQLKPISRKTRKMDWWIKICCLKECLWFLILRALDFYVLLDFFILFLRWALLEWCEQISTYTPLPPTPCPTPTPIGHTHSHKRLKNATKRKPKLTAPLRAESGGGATTLMPSCWSFSATPAAPPSGPAHTPCRNTIGVSGVWVNGLLAETCVL